MEDRSFIGFFWGGLISSLIWTFILITATGSTKWQYNSETNQSNKNEMALYIKEFPELDKIRIDAYSKDKYISNDIYYKVRNEYNYLVETKGILNEHTLPNKK